MDTDALDNVGSGRLISAFRCVDYKLNLLLFCVLYMKVLCIIWWMMPIPRVEPQSGGLYIVTVYFSWVMEWFFPWSFGLWL